MPTFESSPDNYPAALATLVALIEKSARGMDQKLAYSGKDRFVLFYYEPRGEEVITRAHPIPYPPALHESYNRSSCLGVHVAANRRHARM
jgi:hypothetical protein